MKKIFSSLFVAFLATLFFNLSALAKPGFRSSETRKVSGFTGIAVSGNFNVRVSLGNNENLTVDTDDETLNDVETYVEKSILIIRYKPRTSWKNRQKVNIAVNAKYLESLVMSGSGNLKVDGVIKSKELNTNVSGSGSIAVTAETADYNAVISGSGKISIKGKAQDAQIVLSGSGDFIGDDLSSENAEVKISGSGNASIAADKTLDAVVSGSGNIRYTGSAQVTKTKSGSGNISRM